MTAVWSGRAGQLRLERHLGCDAFRISEAVMPMLDRELNDDDALREMARVHGRAMTSVIRVSERDPGEVDELVADVLILAAQRLDDLRDLTDLQLHA